MAKKINYTRIQQSRPSGKTDESKSRPRSGGETDKPKGRPSGKVDKPRSRPGGGGQPDQPKDLLPTSPGGIRLNRYIAHCGICSRREADELIADGKIRVNDKVITEMGFKVNSGDKVFMGKRLLQKEDYAYVLLNKPKDFITTTKDQEGRKTVMDLVKKATDVRLYPVGRLDRNTTGLLLLTNDGELADKLSHPSNNIKKIYKAELNKPLQKSDLESIVAGFDLEDGPVKVDDVAILTADGLSVGVEIHSGKNRIVRRIFENFDYEVTKLDRVVYAGLDKSNLPRGKWRHLSEKEVGLLKKKGKKRP